jgi:hypothetical protein
VRRGRCRCIFSEKSATFTPKGNTREATLVFVFVVVVVVVDVAVVVIVVVGGGGGGGGVVSVGAVRAVAPPPTALTS